MAPISDSFQTPMTDTTLPDTLVGSVTGLETTDPTENEKTRLFEVGEPIQVDVSWKLDGLLTPYVGGVWRVELYSDDIDGVGTMVGLLGSATVPNTPGAPPLTFAQRFTIAGADTKEGVYQLTVVINHSTTGAADQVTEMVGFAESAPIKITTTNPALDTN